MTLAGLHAILLESFEVCVVIVVPGAVSYTVRGLWA